MRRTRRSRRGFSMVELMLVVAIVGLFAGIVIPNFANGSRPLGQPVAELLNADLRRARTEAMVRNQTVVAVAATDGSAWWLATATDPTTPLDGTLRTFGRGGLASADHAQLLVKGGAEPDDAHRVFATFDPLGSRDDGEATFEMRDSHGTAVGRWTLLPGRARLSE